MSRSNSLFALMALIGALIVVSSAPARAEFFGCHDRPGQLLYSYNGTPGQYFSRQRRYSTPRYSASYSRYYYAPRHRRHATYYRSTRYWNGR